MINGMYPWMGGLGKEKIKIKIQLFRMREVWVVVCTRMSAVTVTGSDREKKK